MDSFIVLAAVAGAVSGLYDKYLMKQLNPMLVQSWYNVYQVFIHVPHYLAVVVPQAKRKYPVSLGLDHYLYLHFPLCGRLCLFLCPEL